MEKEELNLVEILKNTPKGTKLYSPIFGDVKLYEVNENRHFPISVQIIQHGDEELLQHFTASGELFEGFENAEPQLFPSKENKDWSTFKDKPKFPTTIEDCYDILDLALVNIEDYKSYKLEKLQQLLIARDAWWKADNDWKPDWEVSPAKFVICNYSNTIDTETYSSTNYILAFRTEEICDKFLDTYKDLIEECKEFI